jgi:hypothetical protein
MELARLRMNEYELPDPTPYGFLIGGLAGICWFYAVGTHLNRILPDKVKTNLIPFWASLLVLCLGVVLTFGPLLRPEHPFTAALREFHRLPLIPVPFYALFVISWLYVAYFVSKELKAVENRQSIGFMEHLAEFFLIVYFLVGVWWIQPRINKLSQR